jgi:hypothetical protein
METKSEHATDCRLRQDLESGEKKKSALRIILSLDTTGASYGLGLDAALSNETPSRRTVSTVEHSQTCRPSNAFIFNAYKNQPIYERSVFRLLFAAKRHDKYNGIYIQSLARCNSDNGKREIAKCKMSIQFATNTVHDR